MRNMRRSCCQPQQEPERSRGHEEFDMLCGVRTSAVVAGMKDRPIQSVQVSVIAAQKGVLFHFVVGVLVRARHYQTSSIETTGLIRNSVRSDIPQRKTIEPRGITQLSDDLQLVENGSHQYLI